jgi:DNA polymerase-3 subunit chi
MTDEPAEILFYHLERRPLAEALPLLVERCLERGWRAVVQAGSMERAAALDTLLWTFRDDSFLPHGLAGDGREGEHPVVLTADEANPNGAVVRFLVDGADLADATGYLRLVYMFDGRDDDAVAGARRIWKRHKDAGHPVSYWRQSAQGRWEKQA